MRLNTKKLTYGGLMTALVFVATAFVPQIPIPFTQGYVHLGDSMVFVAAILLGWQYGAIAGGLGSALADLYLGFYIWILPTLIIKALMGAIVGFMGKTYREKKLKAIKNVINVVIGGGWIITGVYMKNLLNVRLREIENSELAMKLVNEFEQIKNLQDLSNLIDYVQSFLLAAIVIIPLVVVMISILFRYKDKEVFGLSNLVGMATAGIWMVIGYYFAGSLITGSLIVPIFSVPFNILQFVVGVVIAFPISIAIKRTRYLDNIQ
ncbi:ECF transporter S component [Caldisalinibacter kiritimatiensis]|uniref:Substrate-specific component PdxU2 of predicted pyridoxin-related ECF transporter n=1 Tax=Caldisalinibacter kiritimatiensis TaxID=1304284 RepID=R1CEI7_9FIRM|nr:ECF transporter S component [Caldisalinibacter kiritimatiensis]EOD00710.1 Substrate-specific component PdxU2 of predicted pyridoxin-related ECF transporter [Caldisalinibacter kiritimatiensis]